jgi:hypothetical protein
MSAFSKLMRPAVDRVATPALRAVDLRLARLAERLEGHTVNLAKHHESINSQIVNAYMEGLNAARATVRTEAEAVGEYVLSMARVEHRITAAIDASKFESLPRSLTAVGWPEADYLNWVRAPGGLLAQSDRWVNEAFDVRIEPGGARLAGVNERIVEVPHAHAAAGRLEPGSAVLDVGSCESMLAVELASLGLDVTALDPRTYPFRHPNVEVVSSTVEQWRGPDRPFDLITCVSTLEHLGVGAYGQEVSDDADLMAMALFRKWLAVDGEVLITVPYGAPRVDEFQRVYDEDGIRRLAGGYDIVARWTYHRLDDVTWLPVRADETPAWLESAPGVAVLRLRRS